MYIVTHGLHTSTTPPVEFIEKIVYGSPRIDAVLVGSRLIAIIEFPDSQPTFTTSTYDRLATFNLGVFLTEDLEVALREFGTWVRHYAPGTIAGLTPREPQAVS